MIFICVVAALSNVSCSLEEQVFTQTDESYITDAAMAEPLLLGVYRKLGTDGVYRLNLSFMFNSGTDESKAEGNHLDAFRSEQSNAFAASSQYVEQTWKELYSAVYDANYFLEMAARKMETFTEEDQEKLAVYIAEAHALRGLLYFELVRWFGNVPLGISTEGAARTPEKYKQADPVDVYKQIEADLTAALSLPYYDEDKVRKINSFRISKGAVLGLLAKVYATWAGYPLRDESKWELAAEKAGELISVQKHSLLPSYKTLWENAANSVWAPKESLLELSYWSPISTDASSGRVGNFNGVRGIQGALKKNAPGHNVGLYINPTFFQNWKDYDQDQRFALTYADYEYKLVDGKSAAVNYKTQGTRQISFLEAMEGTDPDWIPDWRNVYSYRITYGKWDTEKYVKDENYQTVGNYTNINWYLLRYSDVLLLYAEALNEWKKKPTQEAYDAVNMVRRRAFGLDVSTASAAADLPAGLSYEDFRQAVMDERKWELAGEGHRRQDLIRWGIYCKTVKDTYKALSDWHYNAQQYFQAGIYTQEGKHELLPIPQREIDLCGFKQNQNWN